MATNTKVRKGTFKHVEDELEGYHDTRREIIRLQSEIIAEMESGGSMQVMLKHKKLDYLQNIVDTIDTVYGRLTESQQKVVTLYYWTKPRIYTWVGVAQQVNCNRATAIRWRDEVVKSISEMLGWR